jgi:hypothetical protein
MSSSSALPATAWVVDELHAAVASMLESQRLLGDALERLYGALLGGTALEIDAATRETTTRLSGGATAHRRFTAALAAAGAGAAHPKTFAGVVDTLPPAQRSPLLEAAEQLAEQLYRVGTLRLSIASLVTDLSEHAGRMLSTLRMLASFGPLYDRHSTVLPTVGHRRVIEATA